jgi:hypothetical protein
MQNLNAMDCLINEIIFVKVFNEVDLIRGLQLTSTLFDPGTNYRLTICILSRPVCKRVLVPENRIYRDVCKCVMWAMQFISSS